MPWLAATTKRRKIAVYLAVIVIVLVLMALPIWLGTGTVVLAPGPAFTDHR